MMNDDFYIERTLINEDRIYTENQLLTASKNIVILAEPGAGKTALLNSLANKLNVNAITASFFNYVSITEPNKAIILDAFDELAKIDDTGIHKLLSKVLLLEPEYIVLSSRSSEWSASSSQIFKQFFGREPQIVRLCEFDEAEQKAIYINHTQRDDFELFHTEITKFELNPILPNPQFLKLFADAYVESGGHFPDKSSIFTQALHHLAREVNEGVKSNSSMGVENKVVLASEIFAKLLLSGAEGVAVSEPIQNRMYPLLHSILKIDKNTQSNILATKLFKPADSPDQHRPVHKIVAEYGAATYLTQRINTPADPLTIEQCLSIIAPNGVVRDELRGLLGWMASLGNQDVEIAAIELDAYAVIANGDPSQLSKSSKRLLLTQLTSIETSDPFFRRGDFWRSYSAAGFFTEDVVDEIKRIISENGKGHLRNFVLELLKGSQVVVQVSAELQKIALSPDESLNPRLLAIGCLLGCVEYDSCMDVPVLISESSNDSLRVAAHIITSVGVKGFSTNQLEDFFRHSALLYSNCPDRSEHTFESRYYIKSLISHLKLSVVISLLDILSEGLSCSCGKEPYECSCRTGISKIIGTLLDRYFELAEPPYSPLKVWNWIENLNFNGHGYKRDMTSVKLLQEDHALRQAIIAHVFADMTDSDVIFKMKSDKFSGCYSHAGLCFSSDDIQFLVDLAFKQNNVELWGHFIPNHFYNDNREGKINTLKQHMRAQANSHPEFMRKWAKNIRSSRVARKTEYLKWHYKHRRNMKRRQKHEDNIRTKNLSYFEANRELIENGRDWGSLKFFAQLALNAPEKIIEKVGDEQLVSSALLNCIEFIEPSVPDLHTLAELQCTSKYRAVETVLMAACIVTMRDKGHLEGISPTLLLALRTNLNMGYSAIEESEREALKAEVERLVFPDKTKAEQFLREYLEPQLAAECCNHPEVGLLKYEEAFNPLRASLSIEWLTRFENIEFNALYSLFDISTQHSNRCELNEVIRVHCANLLSQVTEKQDDEEFINRCKFWFIRAFYFLNLEESAPYWDWLKSDKYSIFILEKLSGSFNRDNPSWPKLTSPKVELVLDAFFTKWPKVYLPSSWGTGDPEDQVAYRFLTDIIWIMNSDLPEEAIPVIDRLLTNECYEEVCLPLKSIKAEQLRKLALRDFEPPSAQEIAELLDNNEVVTVEGLRQLITHTLSLYQKEIIGGEFNAANRFYTQKNQRLGEVEAVEIVAERLHLVLQHQGIVIRAEHQTKNQNRIDITASKVIDSKQRLLVIEAKGQWHSELYTAAKSQLYERYSIHPDAEQQGVYLVIWFGQNEKVANRKLHEIDSPQMLKEEIEKQLPSELKGFIDVFVLDVSRK